MNRLTAPSGITRRRVIPAAAAVALFAQAAWAQVYAPGFVWNQYADWVPGPSAGSSAGNPSPDGLGNPVWEAVWVTGDPLGGANPWYLGAANRLEWDPAWFGQAGNGNWVVANDTAPSVGRGNFLTPGAPSSPRVAAIRWIAPQTLPAGLLIDGFHSGSWTNNTSTYQVALARLPGGSSAGAQLLFSDTISHIWNNFQHPVHVQVPTINAGDVIIFTARATGDHGWWTIWTHDLNLKVRKVPTYPVGFAWNRRTEWTARPDYDANTTYGNPALDTQDQPVWEYVHTSGGAVNSPNPWFVNPGTRLQWDPAWFGQTGNGNWVPANDNAPAIGPYSTYGVNTPSADRIGVVRWIAPASLLGGLRITGYWSMRWENTSQPYEAVIARLPGGAAAGAQVLATRTFTIGENTTPIPVDIIVPEINQGDVIVVSARATADHGWYAYFENDLTFTHNCPDLAFQPPAAPIARRQGETVTMTAPVSQNPPLAAFPITLAWQRNGVPLSDGVNAGGAIISGASTDTLTITNLQPGDSGEYTCVATTSCRSVASAAQIVGVYPASGFIWKRSTDWTTPSAAAAGTTQGNPDDDQNRIPVWECGYVTGGRLNSPNPWFYAVPTPMVWDASWFGSSGVWATGNDINPAIGSGGLTDNRVDSGGRLPVVRWIAPTDLPGYLDIQGQISVTWSGGGDAPANNGPVDLVIARQSSAGEIPVPVWSIAGVQRTYCTFADCPTKTFPLSLRLSGVRQGDRIIISSRAYRVVDGYAQHGWNIIVDDLTFRHANVPILSVSESGTSCAADPRWQAGTVTCADGDGPFTFAWTGPSGQPIPADPRFTITTSPDGRSSTLHVSPVLYADRGTYTCTAQNPWGQAISQFSLNDFAPVVSGHPDDDGVCSNVPAIFSVGVADATPVSYQWQIEDSSVSPPTFVALPEGGQVPGAPPGTFAVYTRDQTLGILRLQTSDQHRTMRVRCAVSNECGVTSSDPATLTLFCSADFNCSGGLSVQDLFDMLAAFFAIDLRADFNLNNTVSVQDIFDFIAAYFAGCR